MKAYFVAFILIAGALGARPVILASTSPHPAAVAAKECTDCGCDGPGGGGSCSMEKDKTCHCKKK